RTDRPILSTRTESSSSRERTSARLSGVANAASLISPTAPSVHVTRIVRTPSAAYRARMPPVLMHSSSGCAWTASRVRCAGIPVGYGWLPRGMADQSTLRLLDQPARLSRDAWRARLDALPFSLSELPLLVTVVVLASWQVMLRSYDANGVALAGVTSVVSGTGGDLSQYRILSPYLAVGLQALLGE